MLLRKPSKQKSFRRTANTVSIKESGSSRFYQSSGGESLLAAVQLDRGCRVRSVQQNMITQILTSLICVSNL